MISRAFVEGIVDNTHVKVRIPRINKVEGAVGATPYTELGMAVMCVPPGFSPRLKRGDIVLVAYEDDDDGSPVVLGLLFQPFSDTVCDAKIDSLEVNVSTKLPEDTSIGDVSEENIKTLIGVNDNIQTQIDTVDLKTENNSSLIAETGEKLDDLISSYNAYKNSLETNLTNISSRVSTLEEGTTKIRRSYYGTTKPYDPGVEGQLFIWIQN